MAVLFKSWKICNFSVVCLYQAVFYWKMNSRSNDNSTRNCLLFLFSFLCILKYNSLTLSLFSIKPRNRRSLVLAAPGQTLSVCCHFGSALHDHNLASNICAYDSHISNCIHGVLSRVQTYEKCWLLFLTFILKP